MAALTIISPAMDVHLDGCADIARSLKSGRSGHQDAEHAETFSGETLLEAVLAADADWADAFGEDDPYAEHSTSWAVLKNMHVEPCLGKALRAEGIESDEAGRPVRKEPVVATTAAPRKRTPKAAPAPEPEAAPVAAPEPKTRRVFADGQCHHRGEDGRPDCDEQRGNKSQNMCPGHEAEWRKAVAARRKARAE